MTDDRVEDGSDSKGMYPRGEAEGLAVPPIAAGPTAPVTTAAPCGRPGSPVVMAGIWSLRGTPDEPDRDGVYEHELVGIGVDEGVPEDVVPV